MKFLGRNCPRNKGSHTPGAQFEVQQKRDPEEEIHCPVPGVILPFSCDAAVLLICHFLWDRAKEYNWDLSY